MSDIKLQPLQLERLLGVLNEQNEYESEMSRQMSTWGPIPKTKNKSAQIIKKIFNSSGYDFYQLGDDINLDSDLTKPKDRFRFREYFDSFQKEKEGRGFNFEGMLAGLLNGKPIVSKEKEDIVIPSGFYSVKSADPNENFETGSLLTSFRNELDDIIEDGMDSEGIETPYDLMKMDSSYDKYKRNMLESAFISSDGSPLGWVFAHISPNGITYKTLSSDELINIMMTTPDSVMRSRSPRGLRLSHKELMTNPNVITFPTVTLEDMQKVGYVKGRGKKEDKIAELFGKYSSKVRPDVLEYVRKNPNRFVKKVIELYPDRIMDMLRTQGMVDFS